MASVGWLAFGRARPGSNAAGSRTIGRRLLALFSTAALASSALALAWAGPMAAPVAGGTTGYCDGCVFAWGSNTVHQKDVPGAAHSVVAISAQGSLALALTWDGKVVAWGDDSYGQANVPAGLASVTAIASGANFAMALTKSGSVVAWGSDHFHQTEVPAAANSGVVRIAAGIGFGIALKSDGSVVAWGDNSTGGTSIPMVNSGKGRVYIPVPISGLRAASASTHVLGIKSDGTVVAWGSNTYGQTNVPAGLSNVKAVAAGLKFSLALKTDGSLVAWGDNTDGELNTPCTGLSVLAQCTHMTGFSAIAAGDNFGLALKDGKMYTWGAVPKPLPSYGGGDEWVGIAGATGFGIGLWSKVGAPMAPLSVSGSPGNTTVQVSWGEPHDDGGAPIDIYTATSSPGGKTCSTNGAKSCLVTGLINGTAYTFTVKAHSGLGWGPASDPSAPVTPMAGVQLGTLTPSVTAGAKGTIGLPGPTSAATPGPGSKDAGGGGIPLPFVVAAIAAVVVVGGGALGLWLGRRGSV